MFSIERRHRAGVYAALPLELLSPAAAQEASKAERLRESWPSGRLAEFTEVGSPMTAVQMARASDEAIVRLFEELPDSTGFKHPVRVMDGGSIQAARALADLVKLGATEGERARNADRAAGLVAKLQPMCHEYPVAHVISALAETDWRPTSWVQLVLACEARGFAKEQYRWHVAHAVAQHARGHRGASDALIQVLERWLTVGATPDDDEDAQPDRLSPGAGSIEAARDEERTQDGILFGWRGGGLLPRGAYPVLNALFCGLMLRPTRETERFLAIIEEHLARDQSLQVWQAIAYELRHIEGARDRCRAVAFLEQLFDTVPGFMKSRGGVHLIAHVQRWVPAMVSRRWISALQSDESWFGRQSAGELQVVRSRYGIEADEVVARFDEASCSLDERVGIAIGAGSLWDVQSFRPAATALLLRAMRRPEIEVRRAAVVTAARNRALSADDHAAAFVDALSDNHELMGLIPDQFCEEVLELLPLDPERMARFADAYLCSVERGLRPERSWAIAAGPSLIAVAVTLQRLPSCRVNGIDLFERLLSLGAYGLDEVLFDLDSRPRRGAPTRIGTRRRIASAAPPRVQE